MSGGYFFGCLTCGDSSLYSSWDLFLIHFWKIWSQFLIWWYFVMTVKSSLYSLSVELITSMVPEGSEPHVCPWTTSEHSSLTYCDSPLLFNKYHISCMNNIHRFSGSKSLYPLTVSQYPMKVHSLLFSSHFVCFSPAMHTKLYIQTLSDIRN